jgi:hydrogenase-1 operon protein HyaF
MNPLAGPGSQPAEDDGAELDLLEFPKDMRVFAAPILPEPDEVSGVEKALDALDAVRLALDEGRAAVIDITELDAANRDFINQALGEGEVSIIAGQTMQVQESVFAGVWRVHVAGEDGRLQRDLIEIGMFPAEVAGIAASGALESTRPHRGAVPKGVLNALAIVTELDARIASYQPGQPAYAINLTLLPQTDEDMEFLEARLGAGSVTILSRGYGNCRVASTGTRNAWWVRYFNARDAIVLNTIEVVGIPEVACAAPEDLRDSGQRLGEVLAVFR